jgi:hypothetical protein
MFDLGVLFVNTPIFENVCMHNNLKTAITYGNTIPEVSWVRQRKSLCGLVLEKN